MDDSVKKIVWSFIVCLKNVDFYKLENPRDPLIIYNRFDYVNSEFGSLYEPVKFYFNLAKIGFVEILILIDI